MLPPGKVPEPIVTLHVTVPVGLLGVPVVVESVKVIVQVVDAFTGSGLGVHDAAPVVLRFTVMVVFELNAAG